MFFIGANIEGTYNDFAQVINELAHLVYYGKYLFEQCLEEDLKLWFNINSFSNTIIESKHILKIIYVAELF